MTKYFLQRVLPFFGVFLFLQVLMRGVFAVYDWQNVKADFLPLLATVLVGVLPDLAVFAYFLIPIALYLWAMPEKHHGQKRDQIISTILFTVFTYAFIFNAVSEYFFWDEFNARFNFIAVDYLVYTTEVIGNIMESYPVIPLLIVIGILSLGAGYLYFTRSNWQSYQKPRFANKKRAQVFGAAILCAIISFYGFKSEPLQIGSNNFVHEIGKNGVFELFSAFRNNELSYAKFYQTKDATAARDVVRQGLEPAKAVFKDEGITRHIAAVGPEKKYNVILVTVESLSANFMKRFGRTDNITPNLDKLAENSLFFSNLYATGTRTVYGLSALNLSIPPLPGNSIVRRPNNENLFSLGHVFNQKGYDTKFIYGGFGYFDNMNYFFEHNGYKIIDRTNMTADEITFANIWGVADEDLFNRVLVEGDKSYKAGQPFFSMVMTTSNHRPFTFPEGKIDMPSGGGRAAAVKYTDYALQKLLDDAAKKPWFKNTIIVIVADHTAGSARRIELDPAGYHIPMFIYAPHIIKPRIVDTFASQIDFAPTLLALLNMSYDSRFYGRNILAEAPNRAFISNYQKLGFITPDKLAILKPVKQANSFSKNGKDFVQDKEPNTDLILRAISHYQSAENWREWNKATNK